jgi:hypothetical protein
MLFPARQRIKTEAAPTAPARRHDRRLPQSCKAESLAAISAVRFLETSNSLEKALGREPETLRLTLSLKTLTGPPREPIPVPLPIVA